jgi:O-acetyl-ADP-ribose deacetylase (regulator of RNase III)
MNREVRDIRRPLTEAIILPANGVGAMSRGAALAIKTIAGNEIETEAKEIIRASGAPLEPGLCFVTGPYKMARRGVKRVYHAVTMKYPGGISTLDIVNKAFRAALNKAIKDGVKTIAVPGLGCGDGRLDKSSVAGIMVPIARNVSDRIEIRFIDVDKEFIDELGVLLGE